MFVFLFDYVVLHPSKVSLLFCPIIAQLSAQILQFFWFKRIEQSGRLTKFKRCRWNLCHKGDRTPTIYVIKHLERSSKHPWSIFEASLRPPTRKKKHVDPFQQGLVNILIIVSPNILEDKQSHIPQSPTHTFSGACEYNPKKKKYHQTRLTYCNHCTTYPKKEYHQKAVFTNPLHHSDPSRPSSGWLGKGHIL